MINHSENIWSEGSEAYSKEKKIRLKGALFKGQGLETILKRKRDRICKEENDLCERLFEVVWLYETTYLLIEFKDFEMVKLLRVICPDEKYKSFSK